MSQDPSAPAQPTMDASALYREEVFTDRRVGTIRVLTPVTSDGKPDAARPTIYQGQAQMLTAMGPVPLSFELDAANLAEAVEEFSAGAQAAMEQAIRELQEMRRESASSIVIPETGAGGGKIQLP